jgi:two-component system cell cycle sensor histidine kinase/response regulator CckA
MIETATPHGQPLNILILEDNSADAQLSIRVLKNAGFQIHADVCSTPGEFAERVRSSPPNLILGDYRLPNWSGLEAVRWLHASGFAIPFVLVTGVLGDELAIECLKAGVNDYVLKNNLERLPIAVRRALEEQRVRDQRDRAEEELRSSEEQYRLLFEANPNSIWVYDSETFRFLAVNETAVKQHGYSRDEFMAMTVGDIRHQEDVLSFPERHQDTLASLATDREVRKHRKKDGSTIDVQVISAPIQFRKCKACLMLAEETSVRLRAESALRDSIERYRSIVEGAPYGIFQSDPNGRLLTANPALAAILGYTSLAEVLGLNVATDIYWNSADRQHDLRKYEAGLGAVVALEATWRRKNGLPMSVKLSGRAIQSKGQGVIVYEVFVENITEQRILEERVRQGHKMEAIGRLAGGVAHDFNNLLMVILSFSQLITDCATDPQRVIRYVAQIQEAAHKATSVTKQLLAFSCMQTQELRVLNLNVLVTEFGKMLAGLVAKDVDLVIKIAQEECLVYADQEQVERVLMNLAMNALDAVPNGGKLMIETANVELDEQYSRQNSIHVPPGRYTMLSLTDNGLGMDAQTQSRIFEPFFTTKAPGKGTGLGLATVYGLVKQNNGFVCVDSELGKGSTFKIYLPNVKTASEIKPLRSEEDTTPHGFETILIVEDAAPLRAANKEFLESMGYRVLEASDGDEALRICATCQVPIDLLLTDMVMPGIGGAELAKSILATHPEIRIIYMSGSTDQTADSGPLPSDAIFLQKPCNVVLVARKIRAVLDASARRTCI